MLDQGALDRDRHATLARAAGMEMEFVPSIRGSCGGAPVAEPGGAGAVVWRAKPQGATGGVAAVRRESAAAGASGTAVGTTDWRGGAGHSGVCTAAFAQRL